MKQLLSLLLFFVSILILLDTGWKYPEGISKLSCRSFNPHLTGYGLEVSNDWYKNQFEYSFNPHLTGYGLEEYLVYLCIGFAKFQSSSYWIRAGSFTECSNLEKTARFQSSSYWIRAGSLAEVTSGSPETGFNPHLTGYGLEVNMKNESGRNRCFNPHLTGYGLEDLVGPWQRIVSLAVSILILLDTGWKPLAGLDAQKAAEVSILILLDTGWKCGHSQRLCRSRLVSILILLDTGWKQVQLLSYLLAFSGFNPHLTGYGLEAVAAHFEEGFGPSFNPHLTGYGLEVQQLRERNVGNQFQSSSYWIRAGRHDFVTNLTK